MQSMQGPQRTAGLDLSAWYTTGQGSDKLAYQPAQERSYTASHCNRAQQEEVCIEEDLQG